MVDSFWIVMQALGALGWATVASLWIIDGIDGADWKQRALAIFAAMFVTFHLVGIVLEQLASV